MDFNEIIQSVRRAVTLDKSFYEEAALDERYQQQALLVVIVVALAGGIGSFLQQLLLGHFFGSIIALLMTVVLGVVGYYIWAYLTQWVGAKFFNGQATTPQLLRTLGFAYAPVLLGIFAFIPCIGPVLSFAGWIWSVVAGVFAVRQTHRVTDGQAIITVVVAWVIVVAISLVIGTVVSTIFGLGAIGMNAMIPG